MVLILKLRLLQRACACWQANGAGGDGGRCWDRLPVGPLTALRVLTEAQAQEARGSGPPAEVPRPSTQKGSALPFSALSGLLREGAPSFIDHTYMLPISLAP